MISICIPNYNYEKYLGQTLRSVMESTFRDFEVVIADNASTDGSVQIMEQFHQEYGEQVRYKINSLNLGFAGNLDEVGRMSRGEYMIMLSSDDTIEKEALEHYHRFLGLIPSPESSVITASKSVIDGEDQHLETVMAKDMARALWLPQDQDASLSEKMGYPVYKVSAAEMMQRALRKMANPFNFLCTLYPTSLYQAVGGYGSTRLINPDKWFHWRLTAAAEYVYYLDKPLFNYRWHAANQTAQQANSGHLKYLVDEYRTTMEVGPLLKKAGLTEEEFRKLFVKWDIMRHGLGELRKGYWLKSWRILHFGLGVYPKWVFRNKWFIPYVGLLALGPIGKVLLRLKKS